MVSAIAWKNNKVVMLDQSRLPAEVKFIECADYRLVGEGIRKLWIRGAPAIGIAAAMGIALGAKDIKAGGFDEFMERLEPICSAMLSTRPTAVNIKWAGDRLKKHLLTNRGKSVAKLKKMLVDEAGKILAEDIEVNKAIGKFGAELIRDGDAVLTHCNAG